MRYIPRKEDSAADGLPQWPAQKGELKDKPKEDLEDFIDLELRCITYAINSTVLQNKDLNDSPLNNTYSEECRKIAQ